MKGGYRGWERLQMETWPVTEGRVRLQRMKVTYDTRGKHQTFQSNGPDSRACRTSSLHIDRNDLIFFDLILERSSRLIFTDQLKLVKAKLNLFPGILPAECIAISDGDHTDIHRNTSHTHTLSLSNTHKYICKQANTNKHTRTHEYIIKSTRTHIKHWRVLCYERNGGSLIMPIYRHASSLFTTRLFSNWLVCIVITGAALIGWPQALGTLPPALSTSTLPLVTRGLTYYHYQLRLLLSHLFQVIQVRILHCLYTMILSSTGESIGCNFKNCFSLSELLILWGQSVV